MDNMQASKRIVDETGRLYASLLKKQPPDESQLARPTFRLILGLVTQLMSKCGILKDVFTGQDVDPARLKDKRARLTFLNKLIEYAASNSRLPVGIVAVRILDGQEPNKTLELVQCLLHIAQQRISSNSNPLAQRQRTFTTKPARHQKPATKPSSHISQEVTHEKKPQVVGSVEISLSQEESKLTGRKAEIRKSPTPNQDEDTQVAGEGQISPVNVETDDNLSKAIPQLRQALKSLYVNLSQGNESWRMSMNRCLKEEKWIETNS